MFFLLKKIRQGWIYFSESNRLAYSPKAHLIPSKYFVWMECNASRRKGNISREKSIRIRGIYTSYKTSLNGAAHFKNVNTWMNTSMYSYLETSSGHSYNLYLNVVHFFQHQCLLDICGSLRQLLSCIGV